MTSETEEAVARECWQDLCDKSDRTSPEDYPEMCLITFEELTGYLSTALSASQAEVERLMRERDAYGEIGDRDGYERAIQDFDLLTGGDGEYRASTIADRDCRDPEAMKARIAGRWAAAEARATRAEGLLEEAGEVLGPFAAFDLSGFERSIMLEVVPASPENPSRRIEPILRGNFERARAFLDKLQGEGQ